MSANTLWLTVAEAALHAKVSERTILRACAAGQLRHARVGGRRAIRTTPQWCDDWLISTATPIEVPRG